VPVFNEPEALFRQVLASVVANRPTEVIVAVDGGDAGIAAIASEYADKVLRLPKIGKRGAIDAALKVADPTADIFFVLDSDTVWEPTLIREILKPFADPRVGGVTPRQAIFDPDGNSVRRLADWIEDIRYHLTVPAQSVFGQVGCLAGRTIAYRRAAFEPAVEALVGQRVLGLEMNVGDDRVLTNEILRGGWRTVYQSTAVVSTDSPNHWRQFWMQQLRWGRSSQRETFLSLPWLWKRPLALLCFASDIIMPFWLYSIFVLAVLNSISHAPSPIHLPLFAQIILAYVGMTVSIGIRQTPHFRRHPRDLLTLPLFVLQLTFLMAPTRIAAFATMFHQGWGTRSGGTGASHEALTAGEMEIEPSMLIDPRQDSARAERQGRDRGQAGPLTQTEAHGSFPGFRSGTSSAALDELSALSLDGDLPVDNGKSVDHGCSAGGGAAR
jgi:hyaluronan synthase